MKIVVFINQKLKKCKFTLKVQEFKTIVFKVTLCYVGTIFFTLSFSQEMRIDEVLKIT